METKTLLIEAVAFANRFIGRYPMELAIITLTALLLVVRL